MPSLIKNHQLQAQFRHINHFSKTRINSKSLSSTLRLPVSCHSLGAQPYMRTVSCSATRARNSEREGLHTANLAHEERCAAHEATASQAARES